MKNDSLRRALEARDPIRDEDFDTVYPFAYQLLSATYWTPVETARRATDLLVSEGARRILDVGAGVGKFCLVGAASTTEAQFFGIEHRAHLVRAACDAQQKLGLARVELMHGRIEDVRSEDFDGFYLFNPFAENLMGRGDRLDGSVPLSRTRFDADVQRAATMLGTAAPGTPVVTYFGYGGEMPRDYDLVHVESPNWGALKLWIKNDNGTAGHSTSRGWRTSSQEGTS